MQIWKKNKIVQKLVKQEKDVSKKRCPRCNNNWHKNLKNCPARETQYVKNVLLEGISLYFAVQKTYKSLKKPINLKLQLQKSILLNIFQIVVKDDVLMLQFPLKI